MKILMIGTGYVGLVTAASFAEMGHEVTCLDIDERKIAMLKAGGLPFFEPGLEEILRNHRRSGRLCFTTDYCAAVSEHLICMVAVDTPPGEEGRADLSRVESVVDTIARHMDGYRILVIKSTVPVGTAERMKERIRSILRERGKAYRFSLVSNPEFLQEGNAVATCLRPDRVILGVEEEPVCEIMREIYRPFMLSRERILIFSLASAEMTKYAANAMLACRISFMNELSRFCDKMGADIHQVRLGMGMDGRIGLSFLWAGVGYGGSCFPKDVVALERQGKDVGETMALISSITRVNEEQRKRFMERIHDYFKERGGLEGKRIGLFGLSFKPGTDDLRSAPSLDLLEFLLGRGVECRVFDPVAMEAAQALFPPSSAVVYTSCEEEVAFDADALILCTEWRQFRSIDMGRLLGRMRGSAFFDGRNQYEPKQMAELGFDYFCIGRPYYSPLSDGVLAEEEKIVVEVGL